MWANDSAGNVGSYQRNITYKVFENSQTFNNQTTAGSIEDFILNVTMGSGFQISNATFYYNGSAATPSIFSPGINIS